jgi:hypothetical protein
MDAILAYIGENWIQWLFTLIIIPVFANFIKKERKEREEEKKRNEEMIKALKEGVAALLLIELKRNYTWYVETKGYCSIEEKKQVEAVYINYHNLGGNGIGTEMFEEIKHLPTEKKEDE